MAKKVFALDTKAGVQRDGTLFDKEFYVDGRWVRFQRGRPRKMGGYRQITEYLAGPSRGIFVVPRSNFNNIYSGHANGLQVVPVDSNGTGSGITDYTFGGSVTAVNAIVGGYGYTNGTYTAVPLSYVTTGAGTGMTATVVVAGGVVTTVTVTGGGYGYTQYEKLTATAAQLGGTGSGFSVQVQTVVSAFVPSDDNLWQFDTFTDSSGSGNNYLLAHPSRDLGDIDNEVNTPVLAGSINSTNLNPIGVFTESVSVINGSTDATVTVTNLNIGFNQLVTGYGIPASTTVVSSTIANTELGGVSVTGTAGQLACTSTTGLFVNQTVAISGTLTGTATGLTSGRTYYIITTNGTTTFTLSETLGGAAIVTTAGTTTGLVFTLGLYQQIQLSNAATATASTLLTFDNQVSASGGVVSLHPYVFVYGNDGLIRNCASGNLDDWVSAEANAVNMSTGKIVQGFPVRGGSNAPSGLFWSLDSLIRVSFAPTSLGIGGTSNFSAPTFWRYDIISSQSSMLSSQSVIEYDGIYYWIGVDRFLLYNGVVKEIPNSMNQNWFFDNLNYAQRQKVYATKVPRFGEIWWFYPRGNSEECNDCIIYNIRENVWYDAGTALGARRTAGYFSQVFRFPVNAGVDLNYFGGLFGGQITDAGTGYTNGTYSYTPLTGGTGNSATATITVTGGIVTSIVINDRGFDYTVGDVLTASFGGGLNFEFTVDSTLNFVSLWQHEVGTDEVRFTQANAIEAYIETSDLGWVAGGPAQPSPVGENRWLHLERLEPDFIQEGAMEMYVTGRSFAQGEDKTTGPYSFEPGTTKIDLREQRRELRLKFVSNVAGGDFQMGKVIVSADLGDTRGYST